MSTSIKLILTILVLVISLSSCSSDRNEFKDLLDRYESYDINLKVETWLNDLQHNDFELCRNEECIPTPIQDAILQYERKSGRDSLRVNKVGRSFSNIYTSNVEEWNFSCMHSDDDPSPTRLIEFVISSENHLSIGYATGGLVIGHLFQTYEFEGGEVKGHWTIWREQDPNSDRSEIEILTDQLLKPGLAVLK